MMASCESKLHIGVCPGIPNLVHFMQGNMKQMVIDKCRIPRVELGLPSTGVESLHHKYAVENTLLTIYLM